MGTSIKNSWELKEEIVRLKHLKETQGDALKKRFDSPAAIFSTAYSLISKPSNPGESKTNIFNQDFVSILSRFLIPLTLNKTLFKNSNFIIKTLVGLVSQKASGYINEESVTGVWDKVKHLFTKKKDSAEHRYPYSL